MDIPDLVENVLGDEEIEASVRLGEEDTVYLTGSRTLLYRAEGLLSEERVEEFAHDLDQLDISEGRRKTKFVLEYVDGTRKFTVPASRDEQVFDLLMTGVLREAGILDPAETVQGAFRFSELALIVTETSVVKHIGASVWSADFEVYSFADLTDLAFERGNVATELVIEIDGRPNRTKIPNERAHEVQETLTDAVFQHYDVSSLDQLTTELSQADDSESAEEPTSQSAVDLDSGIDPLVTDSDDQAAEETPAATATTGQTQSQQSRKSRSDSAGAQATQTKQRSGSTQEGPTAAEVAAIKNQLDELTAVVNRQSELLEAQQETINQLIAELREGRG